jgi:tetratricopeptide (TPR) repeat protein
MRRSLRGALAGLVVLTGCAAHTEFGMESPGRPAITWESKEPEGSPTPNAKAQQAVEGKLLAEVHDAEQQGTDELALATSLYNLAILRRQQGELADAEQLYRRALEIRERRLGPTHPDVATTLNNLAALEAAQGNYDAAQPLLERALSIRQAALGDAHVLTAQSMSNLALLYAAQGDATAAEPLYRNALAILEKTDAPGDIDRVLGNYAALLRDTGRDTEADALEKRARSPHSAGARQPNAAP